MSLKSLLGVLVRVTLSVFFAVVFYTGWMAVAIPTVKSGFGGVGVKVVIWVLAPVLTGLGFAVGLKIFELFPGVEKGSFWITYKRYLLVCAIGGGVGFAFGPMLIVFGMFGAGMW